MYEKTVTPPSPPLFPLKLCPAAAAKVILTVMFSLTLHRGLTDDKMKIGLLVPLSGQNADIGNSIIKSTRLAINKINNPLIEIIPKDTASDPKVTFDQVKKFQEIGVKIIIGPVFNDNLIYLEEFKDIIFLSLTNKVIKNPKNIISAGINAESQLATIKKFQENEKLKKTIILTPKDNYRDEIDRAIKYSKIKKVPLALETEGSVVHKKHLHMQEPEEYSEFVSKYNKEDIGISLNIGHLNLASKVFKFDRDEFVELIKNNIISIELSHNNRVDDQHLPLKKNSWYWDIINRDIFHSTYKILEYRNVSINTIQNNINEYFN